MIIESIQLKNIKSYDDEGCHIDFRRGVNLIWGEMAVERQRFWRQSDSAYSMHSDTILDNSYAKASRKGKSL
jgi:hypothetical protein